MAVEGTRTETAAIDPPRLAAVLVRWSPELTPPEWRRLERRAGRTDLALRLLGGPVSARGLDRGAADARAVRAVLEELLREGIGPGIVGAVGRLPGLPARVHRRRAGGDSLRELLGEQEELRREGAVPAIDEDPAWTLVVEGVDPVRQRVEESLLTLADGSFGTRGSLEEGGVDSDPLVVAAGVYTDGDGGPVEVTPTLLPAPTWTQLELHPRLTVDVRRSLDLRTGTLLRVSPDPAGGPPLRVLRVASLAHPGQALLWAEGPADGFAAGSALVAPDGEVTRGHDGEWHARTASPVGRITAEAIDDDQVHGPQRTLRRRVSFTREVASSATEPHRLDGGEVPATGPVTCEQLLADHRRAWARRWERADVEIDGDPQLQQAVRVGLFHLMASVAERGEAAVGARGLTGRAYRGHVFWDADVFVLPFLAATHPPAAAAMLAYRVARLPAARRAAEAVGAAGARFPWESAHDGRDVTPTSLPLRNGAVVDVLAGHLQEHITADVAWAASHYLDWTGDRRFGHGDGRTLLLETARYWRSRVTVDADGRGHLLGVMGPDEYHAPVDDDAYTNGMARWNLRRAAGSVDRRAPVALQREAAAWIHLADRIVDGYDAASGCHEQFVGFGDLDPPLVSGAPTLVAADLLHGRERVANSRTIKQADVLMLHHLLPGRLPRGSLRRDLERYLPLTAHGSSLSPAVHASLLARAGRPDEALELLHTAAALDLDDLTGSTAGGMHLATAGSLWQALAFGFLGLWPDRHGVLELDPRLPTSWRSLTVRVTSRGRPLTIRATHAGVTISGDRAVRVRFGGRSHNAVPPVTELPAGRSVHTGARPPAARR
jgi:trehalose/maltose hydrolase-like predicted phosphorylase